MPKFKPSDETEQKVAEFQQADDRWRLAWNDFEARHQQELEKLEAIREERNSRLDAARHALRADAQEADIDDIKLIKIGPFSAQKKWSKFYIPEKLVAQLKSNGLYDTALSQKIVAERIEIAKYDQVTAFLQGLGLEKDYEGCEDGCELTPAISGPKPAAPLGGEMKEK